MAKWRNFREEVEEEFAEFREHHDHKARSQKQLLSCIKNGQAERLKELLAKGVDPNFCDRFGESPLHVATKQLLDPGGSEEVLELLIFFGAPLERRDRFGITPLHYACQGVSLAVSLLLDAGAPINCQDNAGRTELMLACESRSPEALVIVQSLLDRGSNVNLRDQDGKTALHYICSNQECEMPTRTEIVYRLLYAGADVNAQCVKDSAPLQEEVAAMTFGGSTTLPSAADYSVCHALIKAGASFKCLNRAYGPLISGPGFLISRWRELYLTLFYNSEHLTSLTQVKQLIGLVTANSWSRNQEANTAVLDTLRKSARTVRSLKCSCRTKVRRELLARSSAGNLLPVVDKLDLPKYLQEYLIDIFDK